MSKLRLALITGVSLFAFAVCFTAISRILGVLLLASAAILSNLALVIRKQAQ
ncbi:MAG: hypothetical protein HY068_04375 [Burkholderiales bacterium]|nr:hypothetical protein [Burkholderiales bacterium]